MSRRQPNIYAVMLLFQLLDRISQLNPKPPVTLSIVALNLSLYYLPPLLLKIPSSSPYRSLIPTSVLALARSFRARDTCVIPRLILSSRTHYKRLILASFTHLSDIHVLYNMSSLLYKGVIVEPVFGSLHFLALVVYLALSAHVLYVAIAAFVAPRLVNNCVAGFSGVLFGLKAILHTHPRFAHASRSSHSFIYGFRIPGGPIAPWFELILTSAMMPNVSLLGHFCGIIAGLSYVFLPNLVARCIAPVLYLMRSINQRIPGRPQRTQAFPGNGRHLHDD